MRTLLHTILTALKTAGKAVWKGSKTVGKAIWKALKFASRPLVWFTRKTGALTKRVWNTRHTHPTAWKRALIVSLTVLLAANITMSAVFVAYSVRTRRDTDWAIYTADCAADAVDAVRIQSDDNQRKTEKTLADWRYRESVYTGTLGDNLTWEINPESATLTVQGTGDMDEAFDENQKPAFTMLYKKSIRRIVFDSGVTSIAPYAFEGFPELETVTLGSGMERIGNNAFSNCYSLTTVRTGNSSLQTIGADAFNACCKLTELYLPKTFEEYHTMSDYNRICFRVDEENEYYKTDDNGCLYTSDGEKLIYCPVGVLADYGSYPDYIVPDSVVTIEEGCFNGNHFHCLIIPGSVQTVRLSQSNPFWTQELILREGVKQLKADHDISSEYHSWIDRVQLPNSLKTIDEGFYRMASIIDCSNSHPLLTKTKDGLLYSKDGKTLYHVSQDDNRKSLTVREGTERIADSATLSMELYEVESISLPDSLQHICSNNFRSITLPEGKTLTLPKSLKTIGDKCFTCMTVSKIRIPKSIESIGADFLQYTNDTRCSEEACREGQTVVLYNGGREQLSDVCVCGLPYDVTLQCAD